MKCTQWYTGTNNVTNSVNRPSKITHKGGTNWSPTNMSGTNKNLYNKIKGGFSHTAARKVSYHGNKRG